MSCGRTKKKNRCLKVSSGQRESGQQEVDEQGCPRPTSCTFPVKWLLLFSSKAAELGSSNCPCSPSPCLLKAQGSGKQPLWIEKLATPRLACGWEERRLEEGVWKNIWLLPRLNCRGQQQSEPQGVRQEGGGGRPGFPHKTFSSPFSPRPEV